jgi:hypothetical protein
MNLQENIRRILREKLNEKEFFFPRRIKLDDVKKQLSIYTSNVRWNSTYSNFTSYNVTEQVYYETESYEQFKYELTLRVVETIMWNKYEIGWEDLPSEEEIEFVTEVSNMFEDEIKELYNIYHNK